MRVLEVGPSALPIGAIRHPEVEYVGVDSGSMSGAKATQEAFWRMVELLRVPNVERISFYVESLGSFASSNPETFDVVYMANVLGDPSNHRDLGGPIRQAERRREILGVVPDLLEDEGQLVIVESITPPGIHEVCSSIEQTGMRVSSKSVGARFWKEFSHVSLAGEDAKVNHEVASRSAFGGMGLEVEIVPYMIEAEKR